MTALRKPALPELVEDEAAAALARFHAAWPPERTRRLRDAVCGTPAEKAAANASYVAVALAKVPRGTPAGEAVRSLLPGLLSDAEMKLVSKGHKQFNRGGF